MYKRVLLKLSGEALSGNGNIFDTEVIDVIAKEIKSVVDNGTSVGIVVGGGNIVRGRTFEKLGLDRVSADFMGMVGTAINAMMIEACLKKNGVKAKAMSAVKVEGVDPVDLGLANRLLDEGYVVIFGGGIGNPYFSTDTTSALRAIEIGAEVILMAKNGVDGVYDSDPAVNPDAKRFMEMTFDDILNMNLKVIDLSAASMCKENGIQAYVFNMNTEGNIAKVAMGESVGTLIRTK